MGWSGVLSAQSVTGQSLTTAHQLFQKGQTLSATRTSQDDDNSNIVLKCEHSKRNDSDQWWSQQVIHFWIKIVKKAIMTTKVDLSVCLVWTLIDHVMRNTVNGLRTTKTSYYRNTRYIEIHEFNDERNSYILFDWLICLFGCWSDRIRICLGNQSSRMS